MSLRSSTFPQGTALLCAGWLLGIVTVAVVCCETSWTVESVYRSNAAEFDGGNEPSPDLSLVSFVFNEEIDCIVKVESSYHVGGEEIKLENVDFNKVDGKLVVSAQAEMDKGFRPHFYFFDSNDEIVGEYRASLAVDHSLLTYHDQAFSEYEHFPYHTQVDEIQAEMGDVQITLEKESLLWNGDEFVRIWQVVRVPTDSQAQTYDDCELHELAPSNSIGIIYDGLTGDVVNLEVSP